jgi:hypothetical protein
MAELRKRVLLLGMVSVVALTLGACREGEQGRLLSFEAGKFLGKNPDQGFSNNQYAALRARTIYQSGVSAPAGGSKQPGSSSINQTDLQTLRLRARSQSGSK